MGKTIMQRVGAVPFVGLLVTLIGLAFSATEVVLALAWALRVLEIASVFDRWLPGLNAWELFVRLIAVGLVLWAIERTLNAMKEPEDRQPIRP